MRKKLYITSEKIIFGCDRALYTCNLCFKKKLKKKNENLNFHILWHWSEGMDFSIFVKYTMKYLSCACSNLWAIEKRPGLYSSNLLPNLEAMFGVDIGQIAKRTDGHACLDFQFSNIDKYIYFMEHLKLSSWRYPCSGQKIKSWYTPVMDIKRAEYLNRSLDLKNISMET